VTSRKSPSSSPHSALFSLEYDDSGRAQCVERALTPEVGDIGGDRTRVSLVRDDMRIDIAVEADDLVALRAGLNTWLTLVAVAEAAGGDVR
jgi:KEOPS complex subunit Pcc1